MKKFLGVIMLLMGVALIVPISQNIFEGLLLPHSSGSEIGYKLGFLFAQLTFVILIYFLFKYGTRFLRKKSK